MHAEHDRSANVGVPFADLALLLGRLLMAGLMIIAAFNLYRSFDGAVGYFGKLGLPMPSIMLPVVIGFEALTGLALLVGFKTRLVALIVGLFMIGTAVIAHSNVADGNQVNHLLKNFALLGGCLFLYVSGGGAYAVSRDA